MVSIILKRGDITRIAVDAIVNAANPRLLGGGGVDGAIHHAGGPDIMNECDQIRQQQGGCPVGGAVITTAGNLPALYVIHTVGPIWNGGKENEEAMLSQCYQRCLSVAQEKRIRSLSFPNISTGVYRFPKDKAAIVAIEAIRHYFKSGKSMIEQLYFICFDNDNYSLYQQLLNKH